MSDDLISRKAVIDTIENIISEVGVGLTECLLKEVKVRIEQLDTAFDKEKVKEQIQIFRSKFECTCCPKNIGKHIPVSCDECMDTFAKVNIVIVEKGGIECDFM